MIAVPATVQASSNSSQAVAGSRGGQPGKGLEQPRDHRRIVKSLHRNRLHVVEEGSVDVAVLRHRLGSGEIVLVVLEFAGEATLQRRHNEVEQSSDCGGDCRRPEQQQSAPSHGGRTQALAQAAEFPSRHLGSDGVHEPLYHRAILWTTECRQTAPGRIVTSSGHRLDSGRPNLGVI